MAGASVETERWHQFHRRVIDDRSPVTSLRAALQHALCIVTCESSAGLYSNLEIPRVPQRQMIRKTCSVAGCSLPFRAKGLCAMHYARRSKGSDLTSPRRIKGNGCTRDDGYIVRSVDKVRRYEHIRIAEQTLGVSRLPPGVVVHHWDENPSNNERTNLAIFPDQAYHMLIHRRMRAYAACGHADWRICSICHQDDAPANLFICPKGRKVHHRSCDARRALQRYHERKLNRV